MKSKIPVLFDELYDFFQLLLKYDKELNFTLNNGVWIHISLEKGVLPMIKFECDENEWVGMFGSICLNKVMSWDEISRNELIFALEEVILENV